VQLARRAPAALLLLQLGCGCEPSGARVPFLSENVPKRRPHAKDRPVRQAEELANALRAAGLRRTTARVAVLQRLDAATGPISHGEIAEKLAPAGFDRATVYRNLMDLFEAGLVTRTDLGDHVWRFELVHGRGEAGEGKAHAEHPHFLCTDCGDVACLPDDAVRIVSTRGVPRAVGKNDVEVQMKGLCDACAR
jgi:Fur family ferric uptake transcriptional regulator